MPALDATRRWSREVLPSISSTLFVIFLRPADRENFVNFPKYFEAVSFVIEAPYFWLPSPRDCWDKAGN
jgi:hypothetical protein